jgi:hypothetical protein
VKDILVLATIVVAFATLVTVHIAVAVRLMLRTKPRLRGLLALVIPPLAPIWAFREGWRRSGILWIGAVLLYMVGRVVASI